MTKNPSVASPFDIVSLLDLGEGSAEADSEQESDEILAVNTPEVTPVSPEMK